MTGPEKFSVVIPCYNDTKNLNAITQKSLASEYCGEVIVVDDCSTEKHRAVIDSIGGVAVIRLKKNGGKAHAMKIGLEQARFSRAMFLDADLSGFQTQHLDQLAEKILEGNSDMVIGAREKEVPTGIIVGFSHAYTGERAFRNKADILENKLLDVKGFLVEPSLNRYFFHKGSVSLVLLRGLGQTFRAKKGIDGMIGVTELGFDYIDFLGVREFVFQLKFILNLQKKMYLLEKKRSDPIGSAIN